MGRGEGISPVSWGQILKNKIALSYNPATFWGLRILCFSGNRGSNVSTYFTGSSKPVIVKISFTRKS